MSESIPTPAAAGADTILVGVDGGAPARRALEWALRRAVRSGSTVRAVWVTAERDGDQSEQSAAGALGYQVERAVAAAGLPATTAGSVEQEVARGDVVGGAAAMPVRRTSSSSARTSTMASSAGSRERAPSPWRRTRRSRSSSCRTSSSGAGRASS